jgi:phosphohistidine phosphatase
VKKLLILRHAHAPLNKSLADHDRSLSERGVLDSQLIGRFILDKNIAPDLIISSSAKRALSTSENIIYSGNLKNDFVVKPTIYASDSSFILNLLSEQKNKYETICLVGHEPHLSTFIYNMTSCNNFILNTANLAIIDVEIEKWEHIEYKKGILSLHITPNELKLQ